MPDERPDTGTGPQSDNGRRAYLQWSNDKLFGALAAENGAWAHTRNHAHACFLLIPALLVLVVSRDVPGGYRAVTAAAHVLMFVAGSVALVFWYRVMVTRPMPSVQLTNFTRDEEPEHIAHEHDYSYRLLRARNNLLNTVREAQHTSSSLAVWRRYSLQATIVTVAAAVAPYALEPVRVLLETMK